MDDQVFEGLPVLNLFPGSAAERAGVRVGDRVLFANGHRIESLDAYVNARKVYRDRLELTLLRGRRIVDKVLIFDSPDAVEEAPVAKA